MKIHFASRLNTPLFIVPVFVILAAYFFVGIWLYASGSAELLKDFHSAQLLTTLSDKKTGVELWLDARRRMLEDMAKHPAVTEMVSEKQPARKPDESAAETEKSGLNKAAQSGPGLRLKRYISEISQFRTVTLVAQDGRIIWSNDQEMAGAAWTDEGLLKRAADGKAFVVTARKPKGGPALFIGAPVSAGHGRQLAILIAQPNVVDIASALSVEKGYYDSGRVSIIDSEGVVVAARDMTAAGRLRYNVPSAEMQGVSFRDGLFFSLSSLKFDGLRLIATLNSSEASKPLEPFRDLYLWFAGFILFVMAVQSIAVAPRLLGDPIDRLRKAMQQVGEGDLRSVNLRGGFIGDMKLLADSFGQMVVGIGKRKPVRERADQEGDADRSMVLLAEILAVEVKVRLDGIRRKLEALSSPGADPGRDIPAITIESKALLAAIESLNMLIRIREGAVKLSAKKCHVTELLREAEAECRVLIGSKELELIVDCHEDLRSKTMISDPVALKKMASALLRHAIRLTDVGTVTMLAYYEMRGGVHCLELAISDTGKGIDPQSIQWVLKEGRFPSQNIELAIARDFAEALGGGILMESAEGKGSLITVLIPQKCSDVRPAPFRRSSKKR